MKSEGVKDMLLWLEKKLKVAKEDVIKAKAELREYKASRQLFAEYSDYDERQVELAQERLSVLTYVKISTEKYMKKLQYDGE